MEYVMCDIRNLLRQPMIIEKVRHFQLHFLLAGPARLKFLVNFVASYGHVKQIL